MEANGNDVNQQCSLIWGILWGYLIFDEPVTLKKLAGAAVIISGVILIVTADAKEEMTYGK